MLTRLYTDRKETLRIELRLQRRHNYSQSDIVTASVLHIRDNIHVHVEHTRTSQIHLSEVRVVVFTVGKTDNKK